MENITYGNFPYHRFCGMENIRYVIFPYPYHKLVMIRLICVQAMYKKAGQFTTTRGKRQRENVPTLFDAVGATCLFDMEVAPYCTDDDLASFALTCKEALPCVMALTERKVWPVSILLKHYKTQWTWTKFPERMSHVRRVHMDQSFTSLPGDMGLTSCKEVYFFPPVHKWRRGLHHEALIVYAAMYLTGVETLRFNEALTPCCFGPCCFGPDSDLKIPTSVQTIVLNRSFHNYGVGSLQPEWLLRRLPPSVSTCVLTQMQGELHAGVLPKDLRSLTLDGDGIKIRDGILPLALESLTLAGTWILRPKNLLSRCQAIVKLVLHHWGAGYVEMDHSMYPPKLNTLVLGPDTTEGNAPLKIPGSVKKLVFHMRYTNQLAVGALPEGLTHLELVDVDFHFMNLEMMGFPQSLQYVKISMHAFGLELATPAVDFLNSRRPDILVEVGSTEYCDVFVYVRPPRHQYRHAQ